MATVTSLLGLLLSAAILNLVVDSVVGAQIPPPPPSPPSSTPAPACRDKNPRCQYWARHGLCKTYSSFMNGTCLQSCGLCPQPECRDMNSRCPAYARRNYCERYPGYTWVNCRLSCHLCPHLRSLGTPGSQGSKARVPTEETPSERGIVSWHMRFKKKPQA